MRSREDIKTFIVDIENKFPVDEWRIEGIDFWPIIRIKLFFELISIVENSHNEARAKIKTTHKPSNNIYNRIINHRKVKKFIAKLFLNKISNVDYLFAAADTQRAFLNNVSYSKMVDPLMDETKKSLLIEYSLKHLYSDLTIYNKKRVHFLYDILNYTLYSSKRYERKQNSLNTNLPHFENFLVSIKKHQLNTDNYQSEALTKLAFRFLDFADCYEEILKKSNPKIVFTVCYYNFSAMALNYVANKRNIKTIELQHGPQTDTHMAYANWSKFPTNGFNTLPKSFWNWDKYSFNVVNKWTGTSINYSNFIGGNPWIEYLHKDIVEEKNIILYSLQNLKFDFLFPTFIIESIKAVPNYKWWIRLHPRQMEYLEDIKQFFNDNGIGDIVNITEASNLPLPKILNKTKLHITNFSGCTIEAAQYNIPTILVDKRGKESYYDLIKEQKAFYINTGEEFKNTLTQLLNKEDTYKSSKSKITYKDVLKSLTN